MVTEGQGTCRTAKNLLKLLGAPKDPSTTLKKSAISMTISFGHSKKFLASTFCLFIDNYKLKW